MQLGLSFDRLQSQILPHVIQQLHLLAYLNVVVATHPARIYETRALLQHETHIVLMLRQVEHKVLMRLKLLLDRVHVGADVGLRGQLILGGDEPLDHTL